MLKLTHVHAGYGDTHILQGVDYTVHRGNIHCILGRNGEGKTTTLRAIMGQIQHYSGVITFGEQAIERLACHQRARLGIAYVPETRDIFGSLSVLENLKLGTYSKGREDEWTIATVLDLFPQLKARLHHSGTALSGGEQQTLAIGRALLSNPKVLLLDEPSEGLAPKIVAEIFQTLDTLKQQGMTIILVEQNHLLALSLADKVSILARGRVVWHGEPRQLTNNPSVLRRWLGV